MSAPTLTLHKRADARPGDGPVAAAAGIVYDAECALHAARQSHVDEWVAAASARLHDALGAYLALVAAAQPA